MHLTCFLKEQAPGQAQIAGYLEDITEAKQQNEYMKKFASKKNSVLHILAHDLAGPLNLIQNLSEEIAQELKA